MVTTLENLPYEIQQIVLENLYNTLDRSRCMLVSKTWNHLFQELLYSDVHIRNISQMTKFLYTMENTCHLSGLTKRLTLFCKIDYTYYDQNLIVLRLFACLSKLEYLDCTIGQYFKLLLDALLVNDLPYLKDLRPAIYYTEDDDYITCAILLKHRLKHLRIRESLEDEDEDYGDPRRFRRTEKVRFLRLFDALNHFKSLIHLHIETKSDDIIDLIEKALSRCPQLQDLEVYFDTNSNIIGAVDNKTIANTLPALGVSHLKLFGDVFSNLPLVLYVIHKFRRLEMLEINTGYLGTSYVEEGTLNQIVNYLKGIKYVNITLNPAQGQCTIDLMAMLWKSIRESRVLLQINFRIGYRDTGKLVVKNENGFRFYDCLYKLTSVGSNYLDLICKYGRSIDNMEFSGYTLLSPLELHEDSCANFPIFETLTKCTKLKRLTIRMSNIICADSLSGDIFLVRITIDTLKIEYCQIQDSSIFGNLSRLLARVKHLKLIKIKHKESKLFLKSVDMPETCIGTLSFSKNIHFYKEKEERIILVNLSIHKSRTYYVYDFDAMNDLVFKPLSRNMYQIESNQIERLIIDISCKSLEHLNVHHLEKVVKLTMV